MAEPSIERHSPLGWRREQWKTFEDIVRLIECVRRCWTPEDYYLVQQELEEHIDRVDQAAEDALVRSRKASGRVRKLSKGLQNNATEEISQEEAKQKQADLEEQFYHRLGHQYRAVGDALAWQAYAFQSLPIYALGMNQFPGYRTRDKQKGLEEEKKKIQKYWDEQHAFALHHDCTNCLRIGDLSVFYPHRLNQPELDEVKVAGREISSRQKKRMQMVVDLLTKQQAAHVDGYDLLHRVDTTPTISQVEQTNLGLLRQALLNARENSIGFASNTYLAITVMDPIKRGQQQLKQLDQEWQQEMDRMLFPDIWPTYCTDCLMSDSWQRIARPNSGVPYTIYPLPSDYVAALITGLVRVHYRLNTDAVAQSLREAGFEADCLLGNWRRLGMPLPKKPKAPFFRVQRNGVSITIGDLPIQQIWFEGLRLEDFVDTISRYFDELPQIDSSASTGLAPTRPVRMLATYTNMEAIWYSSRSYLLPITENISNI
jgi:hypothetical protein